MTRCRYITNSSGDLCVKIVYTGKTILAKPADKSELPPSEFCNGLFELSDGNSNVFPFMWLSGLVIKNGYDVVGMSMPLLAYIVWAHSLVAPEDAANTRGTSHWHKSANGDLCRDLKATQLRMFKDWTGNILGPMLFETWKKMPFGAVALNLCDFTAAPTEEGQINAARIHAETPNTSIPLPNPNLVSSLFSEGVTYQTLLFITTAIKQQPRSRSLVAFLDKILKTNVFMLYGLMVLPDVTAPMDKLVATGVCVLADPANAPFHGGVISKITGYRKIPYCQHVVSILSVIPDSFHPRRWKYYFDFLSAAVFGKHSAKSDIHKRIAGDLDLNDKLFFCGRQAMHQGAFEPAGGGSAAAKSRRRGPYNTQLIPHVNTRSPIDNYGAFWHLFYYEFFETRSRNCSLLSITGIRAMQLLMTEKVTVVLEPTFGNHGGMTFVDAVASREPLTSTLSLDADDGFPWGVLWVLVIFRKVKKIVLRVSLSKLYSNLGAVNDILSSEVPSCIISIQQLKPSKAPSDEASEQAGAFQKVCSSCDLRTDKAREFSSVKKPKLNSQLSPLKEMADAFAPFNAKRRRKEDKEGDQNTPKRSRAN